MRSAAFWLVGTLVALVATAGAFLLLASLATRTGGFGDGPSGGEIPRSPEPRSALLVLDLDKKGLEALSPAPDQRLTLNVRNAGSKRLSGVGLRIAVVPAGSATGSQPRNYRKEIGDLAPGESAVATFDFDLSPAGSPGEGENRAFLEARATAEGAAADVKTAVLAP